MGLGRSAAPRTGVELPHAMKYMKCAVILTVSLVVLCGGVEAFVPPVSLLRPQGSALALKSLRGQLPPALRSGRSLTLQMQTKDETSEVAEESAKSKTEEEPPKENMMTKVKAAGVAGLVSYALWEFVFWTVSVPLSIYTYHATTGEWPSFDNPESTAKVSAVIFGFLNVARALVPVRIALTLGTAPLVDKYIVQRFGLDKKKEEGADA